LRGLGLRWPGPWPKRVSDSDNPDPGSPGAVSSNPAGVPQQPSLPLGLPFGVQIQLSSHVGPLPPAQQLVEYEGAHKGAIDWILTEAKTGAEHVRQMESRAIRYQGRDAMLHRVLPFALVAILVLASTAMAFASPILGGLTFFGTLAAVVTVYLKGAQGQVSPVSPHPSMSQPQMPRPPVQS
jgi:uncharacterized membrane protein